MSIVKTRIFRSATTLIVASVMAGSVVAGSPARKNSERKEQFEERTVFVTGSLIPQRVKVRRIGTATVSPIRVIDRQEIDQTGRRTTAGALINDPSVRIINH
jgi:hypothetical protein